MPKDAALEAHAIAPRALRDLQKYYQKLPAEFISLSTQILDLRDIATGGSPGSGLRAVDCISAETLNSLFSSFLGEEFDSIELKDVIIYEHTALPGLRIVPSLLPISIQEVLLSRLLLRDLSNPDHQTNIHLHYNVPYPDSPKSFFDLPKSTTYPPKDPDVHKALNVVEVLEKKLRWMTLGGQYDWTAKEYPHGPPIQFPSDIRDLVHGIFPTIEPEAAICNTYSPGDTLSPHRDVSEEADKDLVSISIGCDALFLISLTPESPVDDVPAQPAITTSSQFTSHKQRKPNKKKGVPEPPPPPPPLDDHTLIVRIRSGDAVVMGGESRWAWHGVPKVIGDTCPEELARWPDVPTSEGPESGTDEPICWDGWMQRKRVNLNIRQMYEH
ncbi:hypothetical protein H072_2264 [Dactylellina haptotyla CBS 200.50]|uniref:Fe2OG dioxygenase domain-containing protein n=1 Tax=Dactylellina haptotyla (strain CBS 200.50) TaxID=1284197 RepID=S8C7P5_DACHA|nr:hypothetical protein H072_2264 [Dactylellina haptotyla CBS 200.50]